MITENYDIIFEEVSVAEANKLAIELRDYLYNTTDIDTKIEKEYCNTQDMGTVLSVVLSSASIVALAKGLSAWLVKKQSRKLTIKKNGDIIGENLGSDDIEKILKHSK